MPIISICSKIRHEVLKYEKSETDRLENPSCVLDLHTSEAPIETSTLNLDLTIDQLCLTDCAINGVLNVYVVIRKLSTGGAERESGKDAIFLDGDAWVSQCFALSCNQSQLI
jgi:hypothetical protein